MQNQKPPCHFSSQRDCSQIAAYWHWGRWKFGGIMVNATLYFFTWFKVKLLECTVAVWSWGEKGVRCGSQMQVYEKWLQHQSCSDSCSWPLLLYLIKQKPKTNLHLQLVQTGFGKQWFAFTTSSESLLPPQVIAYCALERGSLFRCCHENMVHVWFNPVSHRCFCVMFCHGRGRGEMMVFQQKFILETLLKAVLYYSLRTVKNVDAQKSYCCASKRSGQWFFLYVQCYQTIFSLGALTTDDLSVVQKRK